MKRTKSHKVECIFGRWCLVLLGKSKYFATKRWMYKNVVLGWNSQERRDLSSLRDESKYIYSLEQWARLFFLFISSKNKRYCLVLRSLKMKELKTDSLVLITATNQLTLFTNVTFYLISFRSLTFYFTKKCLKTFI